MKIFREKLFSNKKKGSDKIEKMDKAAKVALGAGLLSTLGSVAEHAEAARSNRNICHSPSIGAASFHLNEVKRHASNRDKLAIVGAGATALGAAGLGYVAALKRYKNKKKEDGDKDK